MKTMIGGALVAMLLAAPSFASAATAQQERMRACNADAKEKNLKAADRKQFMSDCLAGRTTQAAQDGRTRQQDRMRNCNRGAREKNLAGADRKKYMSECLRGEA